MSPDRVRADLARARADLGLGGRAPLTLEITDVVLGRPAAGLSLACSGADGTELSGRTDVAGRAHVPGGVAAGTVRLTLATGAWFAAQQRETCLPEVEVHLAVEGTGSRHVAVLLGPFGYTACVTSPS